MLTPFYIEYLLMGTLAKSEDPDEMPQKAAFHQGLHCLLRQKGFSKKYNIWNLWALARTTHEESILSVCMRSKCIN